MTERHAVQSRKSSETPALGNLFASALEYLVDAGQRSILFWDVMRRRGNQYREHTWPRPFRMYSITRLS
jgi:hypothetical protein